MAPNLTELRDAALALTPDERLELAHELELSVAGDEAKLLALRTAIKDGDDAAVRGDYDEVPLEGVRSYLAGLGRRS